MKSADRPRTPVWAWVAVAGVLAFVVVAGVRNAHHYPTIAGPDAADSIIYAQNFLEGWNPPGQDIRNYYTPPAYFAAAGAAMRAGQDAGMERPEQAGQIVNVIFSALTAVLVLLLARMLFPGRSVVLVAAVAFYAVCPVVARHVASFHPQPLAMMLGFAAIVLATFIVRRTSLTLSLAVALGLVAGAAQLTRNVGLWALAASVLALAAAALWQPERRRRLAAAAAIALVVGIAIPLPWYIHLQREYGDPIFGRFAAPALPAPGHVRDAPEVRRLASVAANPLPAAASWPRSFWVSPEFSGVFTHPHRPDLAPRFWPILYTDTWGDYFGFWAWGSTGGELTSGVQYRLVAQSAAGLPLSVLAIVGVVALAGIAVVHRRPELVPVTALPVIGLAGLIFYASRAPVGDGDTVKGLFLIPVLPATAVAFGFACDAVACRHRRLGLATLATAAVALGLCAEFAVW